VAPEWVGYADFSWNKVVFLTRFFNVNNGSLPVVIPQSGNTALYAGPNPFGPALGEVMVTSSSAKSFYRGVEFGMRKSFRNRYQVDWNYTLAKDFEEDTNKRVHYIVSPFN